MFFVHKHLYQVETNIFDIRVDPPRWTGGPVGGFESKEFEDFVRIYDFFLHFDGEYVSEGSHVGVYFVALDESNIFTLLENFEGRP